MSAAPKPRPAADCPRRRGLGSKTIELRTAIRSVLASFDGPMSTRQVFYQCVSIAAIANTKADYDRVQRALVAMRRDGAIPYNRIVDRTRRKHRLSAWASATDAIAQLHAQYRRDLWVSQRTVVHVGCEKQALEGIFADAVNDYGASLWTIRGYISEGFIFEWAEEIRELNDAGKDVVVAWFGDFDPSGLDLERDLHKRLTGFGARFDWLRCGIHRADIDRFSIPNVGVKPSDSRSRKFLARYGDIAAELDALSPAELRSRIHSAIVDHIDVVPWNELAALVKIERESIALVATNWNAALAAARGAS